MSTHFNLPPDLREALYKAWDPETGLSPDAIRTLLGRVGSNPEKVAQETGVLPHYVHHVCTRIRRSAKVEACITRHLLSVGLTAEMIWGIRTPKRPSVRSVPEGFEGVQAFTGRLIEKQHEVALLVDCETSGPSAEHHRAVEVAFLQVAFDRRPEGGYRLLGALDGYTALQDPGPNPVNQISMRIHGIPFESLIGMRLDLRRIKRLVAGSSMVIAHNAEFDHRFLVKIDPELDQLFWYCTYRGVNWKDMGFPAGKLRILSKALGLPEPGHRAAGDVVALYHLLNSRLPDGRTALAHLVTSPNACMRF